jgi:hypothetical protein
MKSLIPIHDLSLSICKDHEDESYINPHREKPDEL